MKFLLFSFFFSSFLIAEGEISFNYNDVKQFLVIVSNGDGGSGSGFIAKENGTTYLYTNQHVVMGAKKLTAETWDGSKLVPKRKFQYAASRDIIRFELKGTPPALEINSLPTDNEPVVVYGNSGGQGVFTTLPGIINGIGHDRIEVSCDFVRGNSGSPIINAAKQVVGIASYVTVDAKRTDWVEKGTRFAEPRRFGFRLDADINWGTMSWQKYSSIGKRVVEEQKYVELLFNLFIRWASSPLDPIPESEFTHPTLKSWQRKHDHVLDRVQDIHNKNRWSKSELKRMNRRLQDDLEQSATYLAKVFSTRSNIINKAVARNHYLPGFHKDELLRLAAQLEQMARQTNKIAADLKVANFLQ